MAISLFSLSRPKYDLLRRPYRKNRKPVGSGLKSQVLARSRGRCERCGKNVIDLRLKPRYHHEDGNPSHNILSNIVFLCNDCHDKVHVYRNKTVNHPLYGKTTKRVSGVKRIKKRGRKKKVKRRKNSSSYAYHIDPITGQRKKIKKNHLGWIN